MSGPAGGLLASLHLTSATVVRPSRSAVYVAGLLRVTLEREPAMDRELGEELVATLRDLERTAAAWRESMSDPGPADPAEADLSASSPHDYGADTVSVTEAADMLDVTKRHVRRLIARQTLTGWQRRPGTAWRVDRDSLVAHLDRSDAA